MIIAVGFTAIGFGGSAAKAQIRNSAKAAPTPKAKKSPAPTKTPAKTIAKATTKSAAKSTEKTVGKTPVKAAAKSTAPAAKTKIAAKTSDKSKTAAKAKTLPEKAKAVSTNKKPTASKEKTANQKSAAKPETKTAQKPNSVSKPAPKTVLPAKETKIITPKESAAQQIIVAATAARVRSAPETNADLVSTASIGKILIVSEENPTWYKVRLANDNGGWISKTIAVRFDDAKREEIYRRIVAKYFKNTKMDFATAAQIADFLKTVAPQIKQDAAKAELSFKHLQALSIALKAIPFNKGGQNPYKDFLDANEKEVVYSEPSGDWYVRQNIIWELHAQFKDLPIGEEIAWQAAQTPLPGECEGYVNCYLYLLRVTYGEYLNFYPGGKYSKKSLQNITAMLDPIVADLKTKTVYTAATDISDRAEFNRLLTELRTIISKVPFVEKAKTIQQINRIGEEFR